MQTERERLKSYNKTAVMKILMTHETMYRAEIARITGLSIPTVMKITDEFIRCGLAVETGKGVSSGGKPPKMLQLIPNARFFVGIDMRRPEYRCAIFNLHGDIISRNQVDASDLPLDDRNNNEKTIDLVIELIRQTIDHAGIDKDRIVGIGIGVPLPVDVLSGCLLSIDDPEKEGLNLRSPVEAAFGLPVRVENTAKVIALAEKWYGDGVNERNFAVVSIGHGVGSAILIDNEIYSGSNAMSGEIGHMVIAYEGLRCRCGNDGCLEVYASVTALTEYVKEALKNGRDSVLAESEMIDAHAICTAASAQDELAMEALSRMTDFLAIGMNNLFNLFDMNLVMMTGGIVEIYPQLCAEVEEKVNRKRKRYFGTRRVFLKPLLLGSDAAMLGAATLLIKEVVEGGGAMR